MTLDLKTTNQPCAFCTKGKTVFLVKSEVYTGRICAGHLSGLLEQHQAVQEKPAVPAPDASLEA